MADIKLKAGTPVTLVASGASVNNAARSALSDAWDNSAALQPGAWMELVLTFGTAPSTGGAVIVYVVPALDGTNYADGSDSVVPAESLVFGWTFVRNVTSAQRLAVPFAGKELPAVPCKFLILNSAGQAISAGWTMKLFPQGWQA